MKQSHFTIAALVLLIGAFIVAAIFHNAQQGTQDEELLIRSHSVTAGNADAKVTLVEFFDPACGTCRQFHPFVKKLMQENPGKIKLVLRYAPFHKNSDQMVAILEAAQQQNRFWETLEVMFNTQDEWTVNHEAKPERFWNYLATTNLVDMDRLSKDIKSPAIQQVIQQDLADGRKVGADKTPTFFVNGKPLPSFGYEQLQTLVEAEVAANY